MFRMSRRLRIVRSAPRVAEMSFTSVHTRFVPVIRHNHREPKRADHG